MTATQRYSGVFAALVSVILLLSLQGAALGQGTGQIRGQVVDAESGDPLPGVNVVVDGTRRGSATDAEGRFVILNVPIGTHRVTASLVGYTEVTQRGVQITLDQTVTLDFELPQTVVEAEEVVVEATPDVLQEEISASQIVSTDVEMVEAAGIRSLGDYLASQPGLDDPSELQVRGGSPDETGLKIDGLTMVNARAGQAQTNIPLSGIEQVSVLTGGFNAEYGEFRSGIVNVSPRTGGTDQYSGRIDLSRNTPHMKRFGRSIFDPYNAQLRHIMDPEIAFEGTQTIENDYLRQQLPSFSGWINKAESYNTGKPPEKRATPMDLYLWSAWMHMAEPPWQALEEQGYTASEDIKQKFAEHAHPTEGTLGTDYNVDAGFGGPIPVVGDMLGDATFYVSHRSDRQYYTQPMIRDYQTNRTTMLSLRTQPTSGVTLTLHGYTNTLKGVDPSRTTEGGFMPVRNTNPYASHGPVYYWYEAATWYHSKNRTTSMAGITFNHVIGQNTFYEVKLNAVREDTRVPRNSQKYPQSTEVMAEFGPIDVSEQPYGFIEGNQKIGDTQYGMYSAPFGLSRRWSNKAGDKYQDSDTYQYRAEVDFTSQLSPHHQMKAGLSFRYNTFDHQLWWVRPFKNETARSVRWIDRNPKVGSAYLQDRITYEGVVANLGLRADYYTPGGEWPVHNNQTYDYNFDLYGIIAPPEQDVIENARRANIWEIWQAYNEANPGFLQPVDAQYTLSPRVGLSFPVTENSKYFFNYGHFRGLPHVQEMFRVYWRPYRVGFYGRGNPRLKPPKTVSYETGVEISLFEQYLTRISGYYKDVTGEPGDLEFVSSGGRVSWDTRVNNRYRNIQGLELLIRKPGGRWISGWLNLDYRFVRSGLTGLSTIFEDPSRTEEFGRYEGSESRALPRPEFRANLRFHLPEDMNLGSSVASSVLAGWRLSFLPGWRAGSYFTWNPLGEFHLSDNMQWPAEWRVDARLTRAFPLLGGELDAFVDVTNLLNTKNSNMDSGQPFTGGSDFRKYMASLHLPMYDSPEFDALREQNPGLYEPGDDAPGDVRSEDKPYINDPNEMGLWGHLGRRDIWFGLRYSF